MPATIEQLYLYVGFKFDVAFLSAKNCGATQQEALAEAVAAGEAAVAEVQSELEGSAPGG